MAPMHPAGSATRLAMRGHSSPKLRFLVLFVLLAAVFEVAFVQVLDGSRAFEAYLVAIAKASSAILRGLGFDAAPLGKVVVMGAHGRVELLRGCDGLESVGLFALAVLLYPAPWRRRLAGVCIGSALIVALNLVRVVSLGLAVVHRPQAYETLHTIVWPVIFILGPLGLWHLWTARAAPGDAEACTG